jgi:hypothetical protein
VLRVPEDVKVRLENDGELKFVFDRDNSDYVYRTADLSELAGRHYDGKRNLIRKFRAAHPGYVYTPLDPGNAPACLTVEDAWCVEKDCDHEAGLDQERLAIRDMLEHFGDFPLRGGSIWVDGQCAAVALGEALNPETLVVHILKAAPGMPGLYQVILNEFVKRAGAGLTAVNLEQDLGLDGLRRAKESYRPSGLARAFTLAP